MSDAEHIKLADILNNLKGMVLVSGYPSELYNELYKGWIRREKAVKADGHGDRVEVLWMRGIEIGLYDD